MAAETAGWMTQVEASMVEEVGEVVDLVEEVDTVADLVEVEKVADLLWG